MNQYMLICKIGEGTFSEVFKARSLKHGNFVAIKCMKNHFNSIEQVKRLKEIQALKLVSPHPHIIKLIEVLYDEPTGRLALVFELMDKNLYEAIRGKKQYLNPQKVKNHMYQLLKVIDHMHKKGIFHRDVKPENILMLGEHIKLADFGSCKGVFSEHPYTEYISTRWYRAPECLLTDGYYSSKMDLWGVGCVLFEIMSLFPLFPGNDELDQIHKIHNVLGTPNSKILDEFKKHASQNMEFNFPQKKGTGIEKLAPHIPQDCLNLISQLLTYNPDERISAEEALKHPYFKDLHQVEQDNAIKLPNPINNHSQNNLNSTKYSPYQEGANSMLYPNGKNPYLKQKGQSLVGSMRKTQLQQFPSFNINLKIESSYKDQVSDEEEVQNKQNPTFLPPINSLSQQQQQQQSSQPSLQQSQQLFQQLEAKVNMYKNQNPKQKGLKNPSKNKKSEDYFIVGKKQITNKIAQQQPQSLQQQQLSQM